MISEAEVKVVKRKETEKIIFTLRDDGIFCTECHPLTNMTIEDGLFSTKTTDELQEGIPHPLLCDLTNVVKITKDCREHFSGPVHAKTYTVTALLVSNPLSVIIGNFFMGLNKPIKSTKLFTNKEKAIEWLKSTQ